ncbi:MAG: hypothetical protein JSS18_15245 [Proteobacteria bacterium]|nr:hypothetical protein [Pseudomonadota bacterium]
MGLFDRVLCDLPLPDGGPAAEFQTKSLRCALDLWRITSQGRLVDERGEDSGFHGVMRFYTGGVGEPWREYEAQFTEGALVALRGAAQARFDEDGFALPAHESKQ